MLENSQIQKLNTAFDLTDSVLNRKYLSFLTNNEIYKIKSLGLQATNLADHTEKYARIFHLRSFVYDRNEDFLSKLVSVVNVAYALNGTIITAIQSDGSTVDYYIGIVAKSKMGANGDREREALLNAFEGALSGNFCGSDLGKHLSREQLDNFKSKLEGNAICSVSVVPSLRDKKQDGVKGYVQGIENLVDALKGKSYTILTLADPVPAADILSIRRGYENVYNYLSPLHKIVETQGTSESINLSNTQTDNYVKGLTEGISRTQGTSVTAGTTNGFNVGVSFIATAGYSHSSQHGTTESDAVAEQKSQNEQFGKARSETMGLGYSRSDSTQTTSENRIIGSLLRKIDKNLERIDVCEGYGAFNSATYIISQDKETALNAAGNFAALMKGEKSSSQTTGVNCWTRDCENEGNFDKLLSYIKHFSHPVFQVNKDISVSTAMMVSGPELTIQLGLPKKSINGMTVIPMCPFGRNMEGSNDTDDKISLGKLYFMGQDENQQVTLDINSLSMHTFITGSTGSGKSTTIYSILDKLMEHQVDGKDDKITFMVVEPAKGEYKDRFGYYPNVHVFGTNDKKMPLLRINPFSFPEDIHVLEHIDRLIEIFNVCWPMYAAMPAVLKDAIERAYIVSGWNLETSECRYHVDEKTPLFPSFMDVLNQINHVVDESAYSYDSRGDYKGALCTRVKSLTNGLYGQIFTNDELSPEELFEQNVIVDLSRVGSSETKSLIMGLLVMKLQEYRMSSAAGGNAPLKHITVLEEAHNILKRTSTEQSSEGANLQGKSVEMLANSIAEMRTYGEGFIIADQAPGLMDLSVIRNTNTKIILRLPDQKDRELVGRAASLNEDQIMELSRLKTFVAAVYQNNWLEPVLCDIDKNFKELKSFKYEHKEKVYQDQNRVIDFLLMPIAERSKLDDSYVREVTNEVFRMKIPSELKVSFVHYTKSSDRVKAPRLREEILYGLFNSHRAFEVTGYQEDIEIWRENIIEVLEPDIRQQNLENQNKILAMLLKEQTRIDNGPETSSLFKHMVESM